MVRVCTKCESLENDGWTIKDESFAVLPRIGETFDVIIERVGAGSSTGSSVTLKCVDVWHSPSMLNGHVITDRPTVFLYGCVVNFSNPFGSGPR